MRDAADAEPIFANRSRRPAPCPRLLDALWGAGPEGAWFMSGLHGRIKGFLDYAWPVIGLAAVGFSLFILSRELRALSASDVIDGMAAVAPWQYALALLATLSAYAMLAWYDRIALLHLGVRHISWGFVTLTSFTTYALSHNIGASVLSGAVVRYRAYSSRGMSASRIAVLVAFCSFTFTLGVVTLGGLLLVFFPDMLARVGGGLPEAVTLSGQAIGILMLAFVALYVIGSLMRLRPLQVGGFRLDYPRPAITARQIAASCLDNLATAAILFVLLPPEYNPGYLIVLAVFLASFSAALISHAPGGLGVFELVVIAALPEIPDASLVAALVLFRLFYLLGPLAIGLVIVATFERERLGELLRGRGKRR